MNRGRSRQVSSSALARQASQERTLLVAPVPIKATFPPSFLRSASPSPPSSSSSMSPDYYDSPPSPPRSLEDQVHEAYALEDIHLAKILLLRLKGVEVTSDDDPRIDAVQDEDFDFCFMPNGPLLSEQDEYALKEMQKREMERIEEFRRVERMRMCERKWIEEKQRMREQKVTELRRRERRRLEEVHQEERRRVAEEERRRALSHQRSRKHVYSFDHLHSNGSTQEQQQQFVYDLMVVPSSSCSPPRQSYRRSTPPPASSHSRHTISTPIFDDSAAVPFRDVLRSIEGQLFPFTAEDEEYMRQRTAGSTTATPASAHLRSLAQSQPKLKRRDIILLEALLEEVKYSAEERRKFKGKGKAQPRSTWWTSPACMACNSASRSPLPSPSLTSSDSSSVSRTSSWLSFRSSSSSSSSLSSSTDLTTPSTSPSKPSWFASRSKSWVSASTLTEAPASISASPSTLRHSCRRGNPLTPVAFGDAPLKMDASPVSSPTTSAISLTTPFTYHHIHHQRTTSSSTVQAAKDGAGLLARRVSQFVELAKGFQSAYVAVTLFSVSASYEHFDEGSRRRSKATDRSSPLVACRNSITLKPNGLRASLKDVKLFLRGDDTVSHTLTANTAADDSSPEPKYIPLVCPFPPGNNSSPPRTTLPDPLPYQLHFKPLPKTHRSPFRCQTLSDEANTECYPSSTASYYSSLCTAAPSQITWRIRFVSNPAYLRLKALQNIVWRAGAKWEGCGRDTAMGGGRERVVGVAYEGVGRSSLCVSVR